MAKLHTLTDDFNDGTIASFSPPWLLVSGGVSESGGRVVIVPTSSTPFILSDAYDALDSHAIISVPVVPATGVTTTLYGGVLLQKDTDNEVALIKRGSSLVARKKVAGVTTDLRTDPYNAVSHRWWRLREASGTFYWETSADGSAWFSYFSTATGGLFDLSIIRLIALAGFTGSEPSPGTLQIDSINPGTATVPGAPTIGTATAANTQATANWTAPGSDGGSAVTGYQVTTYRDSDNAVLFTNSVGVSSSYLRTGLTNGVGVYFKVAAVNAIGVGAQSAASNTVTPAGGAPPIPTGLVATAISTSAINLSWSPSAGATSYNVLRSTTSGSGHVVVATPASPSYADSGLTPATTYYYVVQAVD